MPAFLSMGTTLPETGDRLDIAVWYPVPATRRGVGTLQIDGWTFRGGRELKPGQGSFPLLILSHASAGSRLSHHNMAAALAERGFVVAAPTHPGDNSHSTSMMFLPGQILSRPKHIRMTIDTVLASGRFPEGFVNASAIGIIGIDTGAAAALLLAGATPSPANMIEHCRSAAPDAPFCSQWAQDRMEGMGLAFGTPEPEADARIRAVALLAPAWGMLFPPHGLERVRIPVFMAAGTLDRTAPAQLHAEPIRDGLPQQVDLHLFEADHAAFSAPCPQDLERMLPSLCTRLDEREHRNMTNTLISELTAFFRAALDTAP